MQSRRVVPVDPGEDFPAGFGACREHASLKAFAFQRRPERLGDGVIEARRNPTDGGSQLVALAVIEVVVRGVLRPAIRVSDDTSNVAGTGCDGHVERVGHEFGAHVVGHRVAEHAPGSDVDHRREVEPAFTRRDVGDVLAPRPIWWAGCERPADQIRDRVPVRPGDRGPHPAADVPAGHAMQTHQPAHPDLCWVAHIGASGACNSMSGAAATDTGDG
jgi:hypothetical protein